MLRMEFSLEHDPSSWSSLRGPLGRQKPGAALSSFLGVQVLLVLQSISCSQDYSHYPLLVCPPPTKHTVSLRHVRSRQVPDQPPRSAALTADLIGQTVWLSMVCVPGCFTT